MHTVDLLAVCIAMVVVVVFAAVLARQRYLLRLSGGQPVAFQLGNPRWVYGIARYAGSELRCYRVLGIGTRPTAVLDRAHVRIVSSRPPTAAEHAALPATATVVDCVAGDRPVLLAFSEGGFTGFVSWLEAAAPRS